MTPIEKLRALLALGQDCGEVELKALAPEFIALWEAVESMRDTGAAFDHNVSIVLDSADTLNAKAEEVLNG